MNKTLKYGISVLAFSFAARAGFADENSQRPNEQVTVYPTTVISSKEEKENYLELPARVDTLSEETIERFRPRLISDILQTVPGVHVREVNPLVPSIGVRLPADFNTPYFLSTIDGIPLVSVIDYNHHSPAHFPIYTGSGELEILKGASSVLYGSNAISAVVNLRTPELYPSDDPLNAFVVDIGSRDFQRYKASSSRTLDSHQGYYVSGSYANDDGWREKQDGKTGELTGKYVYRFGASDTVTTTLVGNVLYSEDAGYLNLYTYNNHPTASGISIDNPFSNYQYFLLTSRWDHRISSNASLAVTPYFRHDHADLIAFWNTSSNPENATNINTLGLRTSLKLTNGDNTTFIGVDGEYSPFSYKEVQTEATALSGDIPMGTHYDYSVAYLNVSPFFDEAWSFAKDWKLEVGARADFSKYNYSNHAIDGDCDSPNSTDGKCGIYLRVPDRTDTFSNLAPKAGVSWQLNPISSLFINAGESFKIPNATSLYSLKTNQSSPVLRPERAWSYELGYKLDSELFGVNASIYQIDIYDRIVSTQGTANELATSTNAGHSRHRGVEFGAAVKPTQDLRMDGSVAVSSNDFVSYGTNGVDYGGKHESQAPNQLYDVRINYNPHFFRRLNVNAEWNRVGQYWIEDANLHVQPGYNLYNLRLDYQATDNLSFNFRILNLTDTHYASDVQNYGILLYRSGMPRTIYGGLQYRL